MNGDLPMLEHATEAELQEALSPLLGGQGQRQLLVVDPANLLLAPTGGGPVPLLEVGDPAERRSKLRATAQNLLRLHRLVMSPYGDGPQGGAVLRDAPPRG